MNASATASQIDLGRRLAREWATLAAAGPPDAGVLAARVAQQVVYLAARGVGETLIRELVAEASEDRRSVLAHPATPLATRRTPLTGVAAPTTTVAA